MADLTDTFVAGLLGGGVTGAIVGGFIALWTQARTFRREDRFRFVDLRRERFARYLSAVDQYAAQIRVQVSPLYALALGEREWGDAPTWVQIAAYELQDLVAEVSLLSRRPTRDAAVELLWAAQALESGLVGTYIELPTQGHRWLDEQLELYAERAGDYQSRREGFLESARAELGIEAVPSQPLQGLKDGVARIRAIPESARDRAEDRRRASQRAELFGQFLKLADGASGSDPDDALRSRLFDLVVDWENEATRRGIDPSAPAYLTEAIAWARARLADSVEPSGDGPLPPPT